MGRLLESLFGLAPPCIGCLVFRRGWRYFTRSPFQPRRAVPAVGHGTNAPSSGDHRGKSSGAQKVPGSAQQSAPLMTTGCKWSQISGEKSFFCVFHLSGLGPAAHRRYHNTNKAERDDKFLTLNPQIPKLPERLTAAGTEPLRNTPGYKIHFTPSL